MGSYTEAGIEPAFSRREAHRTASLRTEALRSIYNNNLKDATALK